ncbi:MAG: hypothetical protein ABSF38_11785 [Verrucomicrobiota bacterium]|jgi:hypothetical protein
MRGLEGQIHPRDVACCQIARLQAARTFVYWHSQRAIESQIWENVIPTVVTICILRFLLEEAGREVFAVEKRVFEAGDYKNSYEETPGKLPKEGKSRLIFHNCLTSSKWLKGKRPKN